METVMAVEEERRTSDEILSALLKAHPEIAKLIIKRAVEAGMERKLAELV
jgi:SRSO17 transposase